MALELHRFVAASGNVAHRYAATSGLNASDFAALLHLWEAGLDGRRLTASQLATRLSVTPPAVTYLVDRLVKKGYLERVANPDDRRQVLLQVSPPGGQLSDQFVNPMSDWFSQSLASRSDEDLAQFISMAADLVDALNNHPITKTAEANPHD